MDRWKKLAGIVVGFLMLAVVAGRTGAGEVTSDNLLKNGGFEDGIIGWWKGESGKIDGEVMHLGLKSLRLEGGPEEKSLAHGTAVDPAKSYLVSVYIKTDNIVPEDAVFISLQRFFKGKPLPWYCIEPGVWKIIKTGGTQDWTKYQFKVKGLEPETDTVMVYLGLEKDSSGKVWFDDVEVREADIDDPLVLDLETNKPATNVFLSAEPVKLKFVIGPLSKEKRALSYKIKDFWGNVVQEDEINISDKEGLFIKEIDFNPNLFGWFRAEAELNTGETIPRKGSREKGYITFGILPPSTPEYLERDFNSTFGIPGSDLCLVVGAKWTWGLVHWMWMEQEEGKINYADLEVMVDNLKKYNLNAIHSFTNPPRWASTAPEGESGPYPPKEEALVNYIRAICRFFKTHPVDENPRVYQTLWEPMSPWGWKGTMADIVRVTRIAYKTIKSEDPHSIVLGLCASPLSDGTITWLKELFELDAYDYFDALSMHAYVPGSPEACNFIENIKRTKLLMKEYGPPKDIWLTEQGWSTATQCTDEEQANWMVRRNIQSLSEGIRLDMTFFCVDYFEDGFERTGGAGLFYNLTNIAFGADKISPKPAYIAYGIMTRELFHSNYICALDYLGPTVLAYVFEKEKRPIIILWDYEKKSNKVKLDVGAPEIKVVDMMGNATVEKTEDGVVELNLTQSPIYLHGANPKMFSGKGESFIGFSPEGAEIFPGDNVVYRITLANPFSRLFEGNLTIEVPEGFEGDPLRRKVVLKEKGKESFTFRLKAPIRAEYRTYPIYLKLFEKDKLFASTIIRAEVKRPLTARLEPAFDEAYSPKLSVIITNKKEVTQNIKVKFVSPSHWEVNPEEIPLTLTSKSEGKVKFNLNRNEIEPTQMYDVTVETISSEGKVDRFSSKVNFSPCKTAKEKVTIDGSLKKWANVIPVILRDKEQVLKKGQHLWKGPEDLSAKIYTMWDKENFYFAAKVRDDVFHQKKTGDPTWQEDSIQIAIDPYPEAEYLPIKGLGKKNYEYNIALTEKGPEVYRGITGDEIKNPTGLVSKDNVSRAVVKMNGGIIYEMAIPWKLLSRDIPKVGDSIGISVAVCDADSDESWATALKHILWFDGIVMGKQPEKFGRLTLCE